MEIIIMNWKTKKAVRADEIVKSRLNISHPKKNVNILTKILEIIFDQQQHLLVYQPEGITSTARELEITKAQKVKWLYIPYGSKTTEYNTITYTYNAKSKTVIKETKFGTEQLRIKEPFCAVYMAK